MIDKYIISIDLDGTLLNDNKNISAYTLNVLKKCQKLGSKIMINTSRSYLRTLEISEMIKADFISCFNGNYICAKDKTYYSNSFKDDFCKELINIIIYNKINVILECINGTYRNRLKDYKFMHSDYFDFKKLKIDSCFKILVTNKKDINYFKELITNNNLVAEYDSINKLYRILPPFSDKLNAVKYISKLLGNKYKTISFGDDISDLNTLKFSDIGIKMENAHESLAEIRFLTYSNNQDGVAKFLSNMFNLDMKTNYDNVKLLDCTLRDGGHLNKSNFGYDNIIAIIKNLVKSKIDIIELGFLEDCLYDKNIARFNKVCEANNLLSSIDSDSTFALLMQVDKFDIGKLDKCCGKIKMIRVSFHKNLLTKAIEYCHIVKQKGYICSLNPINFSGYSNYEVVELLKIVNETSIDYFTVVDTFGILNNNSFSNKLSLINKLLRDDINLGLHLHDNLSSSFSTAQILMKENSRYCETIIDCSLAGMGRAPGNLKTELIMYYLNLFKNNYEIKYVYKLLESVIRKFKEEYDWSQDFSYSISAFEKVHRTYAEFLKNKNINYQAIEKIIKAIPDESKDRFNEEVINSIYNKMEDTHVFR